MEGIDIKIGDFCHHFWAEIFLNVYLCPASCLPWCTGLDSDTAMAGVPALGVEIGASPCRKAFSLLFTVVAMITHQSPSRFVFCILFAISGACGLAWGFWWDFGHTELPVIYSGAWYFIHCSIWILKSLGSCSDSNPRTFPLTSRESPSCVWHCWLLFSGCIRLSEWLISKFNGTSTPNGSHSAKTGVNYSMSEWWWWYHILMAHQHKKGHTVPKQVIMIATSIQVATV